MGCNFRRPFWQCPKHVPKHVAVCIAAFAAYHRFHSSRRNDGGGGWDDDDDVGDDDEYCHNNGRASLRGGEQRVAARSARKCCGNIVHWACKESIVNPKPTGWSILSPPQWMASCGGLVLTPVALAGYLQPFFEL